MLPTFDLGFETRRAEKALSLPQFFSLGNGHGQTRDRRSGGLRPKERETITRSLQEGESWRKSATPEFLVIRVDGIERCRVGLNGAHIRSLEVDAEAEFMEIMGEDDAGDVVLGNLLFAPWNLPPCGKSKAHFISLENGHELRVVLTPRADEEGEYLGSALTFEYREKVWAALPSRIGSHLTTLIGLRRTAWTSVSLVRLVVSLALALAFIIAGLLLVYRHTRQPTNLVARVAPSSPAAPVTPSTAPVESGANNNGEKPGSHSLRPGVTPSTRSGQLPGRRNAERATAEDTRSLSPENRKELSAIKRLYVEDHPDANTDAPVRTTLIRQLSGAGRFVAVDDPEQADGFLLWSLRRRFEKSNTSLPRKLRSRTRLSIQLTNKEQRVLWRGATDERDDSPTKEALVKDLLSKLQNARQIE